MGRPLEAAVFDATYYPVAAVSCVFFLCVFKFVSPSISAKICSKYSLLSQEQKVDWNTRVLSTVHATVVSSMCAYTLFYDEDVSNTPIWWDSPVVRTSCAIVVGYMTADIVIMCVHYKHIGEAFYFFHHGASMYAYYYVMTYGVLPYFANYRLVAEFSTPFVNQRWFLAVLGYGKTSPLFVANGIAMAVTFFGVRVAVMPPYWHKVYSVYGTDAFHRLGHIQMVLIVSCAVLDIINLYWFYKIYAGAKLVLTLYFNNSNRSQKERGLHAMTAKGDRQMPASVKKEE